MLQLFEEPEEAAGLISASILGTAGSFWDWQLIQVCLTRAELSTVRNAPGVRDNTIWSAIS